MTTYTAIALDRFIEPGASKTIHKSAPTLMPVLNSKKLERRSSEPTPTKKAPPHPQLKPALYATPEVTPLPDSPSSFPPSPYIINHKRRGPCLLKSFSETNVQNTQKLHDDENVKGKSPHTAIASSAGDVEVTSTNLEPVKEELVNGIHDATPNTSNGDNLVHRHKESGSGSIANGLAMEKTRESTLERDEEDQDIFDDPQESMSLESYPDVEDISGIEHTMKLSTPGGEFFDAWDELSFESGAQSSLCEVKAELHEIRLSLLLEIEKRKQAEEALNSIQSQWERVRQALSVVGIVLPSNLTVVTDAKQLISDPVEALCQQFQIARFVSNTIGRGTAKAEVEMEMEAQLESKGFEIARLMERLYYYETMNREMSQRNQEVVETARRARQIRSRRRKWMWGCVTTTIVLGTTAIAWAYLPMGKGSMSADHDLVPEYDDASN